MNGNLPMYDRSFDQLVFADTAFSRFCILNAKFLAGERTPQIEKDMDDLVNALIGILFTKPEDFDAADLEVYTKIIPLHFNSTKRSLVLHTYANVRGFIIRMYPNLFPTSAAPEEGAEPGTKDTGPMWMNLRYDLAETDAFKGFDTARKALIYDALGYLDKKATQLEQQRREHAQK
jgi:hypothetical protein